MRTAAALLAALAATAGFAACGGGAEPGASEEATLVLDFTPNAVHAGIYAALGEGFYRRAGVHLTVRPPSSSADAPKLLAAGRTDFAILDIHDLAIARRRGFGIVGVAPIVDRPLASVIAPAAFRRAQSTASRSASARSPRLPPAESTPRPRSGTTRG